MPHKTTNWRGAKPPGSNEQHVTLSPSLVNVSRQSPAVDIRQTVCSRHWPYVQMFFPPGMSQVFFCVFLRMSRFCVFVHFFLFVSPFFLMGFLRKPFVRKGSRRPAPNQDPRLPVLAAVSGARPARIPFGRSWHHRGVSSRLARRVLNESL